MRRLPLALLVLVAVGCADPSSPWMSARDALVALDAAEAQWLATRPITYVVVQERWCECGTRPVELTATRRQGAIIPSPNEMLSSASFVGGGPVDDALMGSVLTIQDLFAFIRAELQRTTGSVALRFDAAWGFPVFFRFDPNTEQWADETQIKLSDFRALGERSQ